MEDLIIGLQIRPTIELTDKDYDYKFKLLVEEIGEIINTDEGTKIGSFNSRGYGYCYVKESKKCIEHHIKLALALKEKVVNYLNNEIKQHE
jgi:hypothetical protein